MTMRGYLPDDGQSDAFADRLFNHAVEALLSGVGAMMALCILMLLLSVA